MPFSNAVNSDAIIDIIAIMIIILLTVEMAMWNKKNYFQKTRKRVNE